MATYGQSQNTPQIYDYAKNLDKITPDFIKQLSDTFEKNGDVGALLGGSLTSSQQNGAFSTVGQHIKATATQQYLAQAAKLKALDPNFDPDKYFIPFQGNFGEGAAANRSAVLLRPLYDIQAQNKALKAAQAAYDNYKATGQITAPDALAGKAPVYSPEDMAKYNAAAARVGTALPYAGAPIKGDTNGGIFANNTDAQKFYDSGKPLSEADQFYNQPTQKSGVPTNPTNPNLPQRSKYQAGPTGDRQYARALSLAQQGGGTQVGQPMGSNVEHPIAKNALDSLNLRTQRGQPTVYGTPEADAMIKANAASANAIQNQPTNITNAQTPEDANAWLNALGEDAFSALSNSSGPALKGDTSMDLDSYFSNAVNPSVTQNSAPTFSAVDKLNQLRTQQGVDPLEKNLADLNKEEADLNAIMRQNAAAEQGKTVALGVMGGRISEEERQYNERLDTIQRKKAYVTDQLKTQYGVIDQYMKAAGDDYEMASQKYQQEFSNKIQSINLLRGIHQDQLTEVEKQKDDARANFSILSNAISAGTLDWSQVSPEQKLLASKLEMQAGLPPGTLQAFSQKAGSQWDIQGSIPGVDKQGNAITTFIKVNKTTGEIQPTIITTGYESRANSAKSNILDSGTYVNDKGQQVRWQLDQQGNKTEQILGNTQASSKVDSKAQDNFKSFSLEVAKALNKRDSFGDPVEGAIDDALKLIQSQYPGISEAQINQYFPFINQ